MAQAITHDAGYSGLSYEAGVSDKFTLRSNTIGDGTSFKYSLRYTWNGLVDIGVANIQSYIPEYSGSYLGLYLPGTQVFSSWVVTRQLGGLPITVSIDGSGEFGNLGGGFAHYAANSSKDLKYYSFDVGLSLSSQIKPTKSDSITLLLGISHRNQVQDYVLVGSNKLTNARYDRVLTRIGSIYSHSISDSASLYLGSNIEIHTDLSPQFTVNAGTSILL